MTFASRSSSLKVLAIVPLVCLLAAGCNRLSGTRGDSALTSSQRMLLQELKADYDVSPNKRPPKDTSDANFPPGHSVPDNAAPDMSIATLTLKAGRSAPSTFIAVINSSGAFTPMGIEAGNNLVWRDAAGTAYITPLDVPGSDHPLVMTPRYQFPRRPEHEASLLRVKVKSYAFVVCLDGCGSGHCGMF